MNFFKTNLLPELILKNFVEDMYEIDTNKSTQKIDCINFKNSDKYDIYSDKGDCISDYMLEVNRVLERLKVEVVDNVDSVALLSLLSNYEIANTYGYVVINNKTKESFNPMNIFGIDEFLEKYLIDYKETNYKIVRFTYPKEDEGTKDLITGALEDNFAKLFELYTAISNNKKTISISTSCTLKSCNSFEDAFETVVNDFKKEAEYKKIDFFRFSDMFKNDYSNDYGYFNDSKFIKRNIDWGGDEELEKSVYNRSAEFLIPVNLATRFITYPYYGLIAITGYGDTMIGRNLSNNFTSGNISEYKEESERENRYYLHFDGNDEEIDEYDYEKSSALEIAECLGYDTSILYNYYYYFDGVNISEDTYNKLYAIANDFNGSINDVLSEDSYEAYVDIFDTDLSICNINESIITKDSTYRDLADLLSDDSELDYDYGNYCYTWVDDSECGEDETVVENDVLYTPRVCLGDNPKEYTYLPVMKNMNIDSMYHSGVLGEYYKEEAFNHQTISQAIIKKFIIDNKL